MSATPSSAAISLGQLRVAPGRRTASGSCGSAPAAVVFAAHGSPPSAVPLGPARPPRPTAVPARRLATQPSMLRLPGPADAERTRRHVLGDHRARRRVGAVADRDRRDQHGVAADPHVVADHRCGAWRRRHSSPRYSPAPMFAPAPIVASPTYDRCGTLAPGPISLPLTSTYVPDLAARAERAPGPQVGERADLRVRTDLGARGSAPGPPARPRRRRCRRSVQSGPISAPAGDRGAPVQLRRPGCRTTSGRQRDLRVHPGGGRVDHASPRRASSPPAAGRCTPGAPRRAAPGRSRPRSRPGRRPSAPTAAPGGDEQADDVGQVFLALRVRGGQPAQRVPQRAGLERVHAGVDLADGPLLVGGVAVLDDRGDRRRPRGAAPGRTRSGRARRR